MKNLHSLGMSAVPALIALAFYHLAVGLTTYHAASELALRNGKELPEGSLTSLVLYWPGMLVNAVHANERWADVMIDIQGTLHELNSGRWQRLGDEDGDQP